MKIDGRRDEQANCPDSMDKYYQLDNDIINVTSLSINETVKIALGFIEM